jgi:hypothetical protein
VDYAKRADYLLEADLGVSTHYDHVETAYSFRTRILDYLWAGLPILATEGDSLSRLVKTQGWVSPSPPRTSTRWRPPCGGCARTGTSTRPARTNVRTLAPEMTWEKALAPIAEFARNPHRAADVELGEKASFLEADVIPIRRTPTYLARRTAVMYGELGPRETAVQVRNWVQRRLRG